MTGNNKESRNIHARLVKNSNGTWTITEASSLDKPEATNVNQLFKTTGPDGNVVYFLGNQQNKGGVTAVDPDNPRDGKPPHSGSASSTSDAKTSQLTEAQAKSFAKLLSSVKSQIPTVKQSASVSLLPSTSLNSQSPVVQQSASASLLSSALVSPSPSVRSQIPIAQDQQVALAAQHTVCKESVVQKLVQVTKECDIRTASSNSVYKLLPKYLQRNVQGDTNSSGSGYCVPIPKQFHRPVMIQTQQSAALPPKEPSVIHLASGKETKITFDLGPHGKGLIKNVSSKPKPICPYRIHRPGAPPDKGVYLGTFKVPASQKGIDPILSRFSTTVGQCTSLSLKMHGNGAQIHTQTSMDTSTSLQLQGHGGQIHAQTAYPSLQLQQTSGQTSQDPKSSFQLQETAGHRNTQTYLNTPNSQFVIVNSKPVATVKPEPAVPLYSDNQTPTAVVNSSYVAMMPTVVPTYYRPVILNQTTPLPPVIRNQIVTQAPAGNTHILNSTEVPQPQIPHQRKVASYVVPTPQTSCLEKVVTPDVCAEVVIDSNDNNNSDHYEVKLETPDNLLVPRIESVFSLTGDCVSPFEDVACNTSLKVTRKRKRKKPKRPIKEEPISPPQNSSAKKKPFLKPVVFDPCFVVLDPLQKSVMMELHNKLRTKQAKALKKQKCTRLSHEQFLKKLCNKRSIPCNRYLDKQNGDKVFEEKREVNDSKLHLDQRNVIDVSQKLDSQFNVIPQKRATQKRDRSLSDHNPNLNVRPLINEGVGKECPVSESVKTNTPPLQDNIHSQNNMSEVLSPVRSFDKCKIVPLKCPSSDTESESCISSELEETSPVKSSNKLLTSAVKNSDQVQKDVGEEEFFMVETDDVLNVQNTTMTSTITESSPIQPDQSSPKHEPQLPTSLIDIDDYLFHRPDHEQKEEKQSTKEESDDDWGNMELEVDPDSEADEPEAKSPVFASHPDPLVLPKPEPFPEPPFAETHYVDTVTSPVLSERVQRLKAMLAEQSRQVDSLRRLRRRTK